MNTPKATALFDDLDAVLTQIAKLKTNDFDDGTTGLEEWLNRISDYTTALSDLQGLLDNISGDLKKKRP